MQQVGLPQAGAAVDEEGVIGLAGLLGDAPGGGVGQAVSVADDEGVKGVAGVKGEVGIPTALGRNECLALGLIG